MSRKERKERAAARLAALVDSVMKLVAERIDETQPIDIERFKDIVGGCMYHVTRSIPPQEAHLKETMVTPLLDLVMGKYRHIIKLNP